MKNLDLTNRIDLVGGKVLASGSLEGSRRLLQLLLKSWTAHSVVAFSSNIKPWVEVLAHKEGMTVDAVLDEMKALDDSEILSHDLDFDEIFDENWHLARRILSGMNMDFHKSGIPFAMGPDFVLKIGENAPTPDFVIAHANPDLTEYYLTNVCEIVVETKMRLKNFDLYKDLYANAGVKELWVIDIAAKSFSVFKNQSKKWQLHSSESDNYESFSIKGLKVHIPNLWKASENAFIETDSPVVSFDGEERKKNKSRDGIEWGDVRFAPVINFDPTLVTFEQFISWAGESKFEWFDNKFFIGSEIGSRNAIGLLAQTLGFNEIIDLLPKREWLIALRDRRIQLAHQELLRESLLKQAKQAAELLRTHFDFKEMAIYGDWLKQPTINKWTEVTIVIPDDFKYDYYEVYKFLNKEMEEPVNIVKQAMLSKSDTEQLPDYNLQL